MSEKSNNLYRLLDGMLKGGLPYIASFVEKQVRRPIIITDVIGRIHYPDEPGTLSSLEEIFLQLPLDVKEDEYHYDNTTQSLYYHIGHQRESAYIIVKNIPQDMIEQVLSFCDGDVKIAIKYYFNNLEKMREKQVAFKKELAEYLLFKSNANIRDIIKLSRKDLDVDQPFLVAIAQGDELDKEIDWEFITSHTSQHLKRIDVEIIPIAWTNCMVSIFPAHFKKNTLEIDPEWLNQIYNDSLKFIDIVGNVSNQTISTGIGQIYPLSDLHRSFIEARIAITIPRLLHEKNFAQKFADLGIFSVIFSQNLDVIKNYCHDTLTLLIEYDKHDGELLSTLRELVNNGFNRKATAASMFAHINTIHYREAKIEQILNLDLSQTYNRFNLFAAIIIYDTLRINGFLD